MQSLSTKLPHRVSFARLPTYTHTHYSPATATTTPTFLATRTLSANKRKLPFTLWIQQQQQQQQLPFKNMVLLAYTEHMRHTTFTIYPSGHMATSNKWREIRFSFYYIDKYQKYVILGISFLISNFLFNTKRSTHVSSYHILIWLIPQSVRWSAPPVAQDYQCVLLWLCLLFVRKQNINLNLMRLQFQKFYKME